VLVSAETAGLAEQFRRHATRHEPLYATLLLALADDLDADGPTASVLRDHLGARTEQAVHLRLLAGLQRLVLRGDAPELAPWFDEPEVPRDAETARELLVPLLHAHADELRAGLDRAPQTNEVGRSACLLIGLFEAVRRHGTGNIRLLELGASAGLNLNVDRYRFTGPDWAWGPPESPVVLDTGAAGVRIEEVAVAERRGCDLAPVDGTDPEQARYLRSFVWPSDRDRQQRLLGALEVLGDHPVVVDRAPASGWLREQLAPPGDGLLTVVWQSITEQYWPAAESQAVRAVLAEARARQPVVHVTMEGVRDLPEVRLDGDLIARSGFHGPPITLV
jgi:hypothetical protein